LLSASHLKLLAVLFLTKELLPKIFGEKLNAELRKSQSQLRKSPSGVKGLLQLCPNCVSQNPGPLEMVAYD
jgi:hypothetical protein